ncbi:hypothetical protein CK203_000051 [Vitis vinifera]|uniref:Retrovirus-related Pol polyprotein from transposon TNT 1-94 n=1 Tax=Vitis vinifera TaxID=29760 RepID=A0A438KRV3_VITVI|nr:hypothetical protein CK203_000051 [Vitis vinifera]
MEGRWWASSDYSDHSGQQKNNSDHTEVSNADHTKLAVTSNDPIVESETGIKGDNQFSNNSDDLDLPIALRKGTQSCIVPPISQFASLQKLSPQFCAFITKLANHEIAKNVQEAMSMEPWKEAMKEEM